MFFPFKRLVVNGFHWMYWRSSETWLKNKFLGYYIQQLPLDLQLYQEIIYDKRPSYIIQTGVAFGGSILYFASLLDLIDAESNALVIGIDIKLTSEAKSLSHPRIRLIEGNSVDNNIINKVREIVKGIDKNKSGGMVILDSDHSYPHVLNELKLYSEFVGVNQYLVVEDTHFGFPVNLKFGKGPLEAVKAFLKLNKNFEQNNSVWERNFFSFHEYGWLLRIE